MLIPSLGVGVTVVDVASRAVADLVGTAVPRSPIELPPPAIRQLLFVFRSSIHGRIPEILGEDEEERVETLVALLQGSSEEDLTTLLDAAQVALTRLEATRSMNRRRPARRRTGHERPKPRPRDRYLD